MHIILSACIVYFNCGYFILIAVISYKGIPIMEHESIYEKDISEHFGLINMNLRINLFKEWLINRPESCIAVVGHSAFFRDMLNTELKLKNCEVKLYIE